MLSVGGSVTNHFLQEDFEGRAPSSGRAGLLVNEVEDMLHASTTSEESNGGLGDALDVVAEHLPVALGAALAETFATLATSRHF